MPNAGAHLLPKAGATQERTLEAVRCSAWFGVAPSPVRSRQAPPPMIARASCARCSASSCLIRCTRDTDNDAHAGLRRDDLREREAGRGVQCTILRLRALLPTRADQHVEVAQFAVAWRIAWRNYLLDQQECPV